MPLNAITQLERDLITVLKREYGFYQSLYILLDKQRDLIKFDKDDHLLDLYAETERCQRRIRESEEKITDFRRRDPKLFRIAAAHPEIKKLVTSIVALVKKNMALVRENEAYLRERHARLKLELDDLRNSDKILQYLAEADPAPQLVDGRQ